MDGVCIPDYLDPDSDSDGKPDAEEGAADSDSDGIPDAKESNTADTDGDGLPDALDPDSDGDGIPGCVSGYPYMKDSIPEKKREIRASGPLGGGK